jgi:phospholipid/cholesterol/gamma-HCH transport system substrate-binding protein
MAEPVHRDDARRFVFGLGTLALLVVVAIMGGIVQTGGALPGKRYTYVTATFDDVGILKPGKPVRTGGVRVGTVSDIEYADGDAVVTLRLDGDRDVYADATAFVGNISALGKKYVDLDPGTQGAGQLGPEGIRRQQTTAATSVEDIFSVFDPKTRRALQSALGELSAGTAGHGDDLNVVLARSPELLEDVETLMEAGTSAEADLPGLLTSAETLVGRFRGRERQIAGLLRNSERTFDAFAVDEGAPLRETISELPPTLVEAKAALDALHEPLVEGRAAIRSLRPGAEALGRSTPDLRRFLRKSVDPLGKVEGLAEQAEPVVADLTDTVADARPLAETAARTVRRLDQFLLGLAPYADDAGRFFSQHDLLSGQLGPGRHYFAAQLTGPGLFTIGGLPDPLYRGEYYPEPGSAWNHDTVTDAR